MKRILAILLILFVVVSILNNFLASLFYENNNYIVMNSNNDKSALNGTITPKDSVVIKLDSAKILNKLPGIVPNSNIDVLHDATWYRTHGTRVHREYPTAAYNKFPKGTRLLVTNIDTGDTCVVEVTDRMGNKTRNKIDLSHSAFGKIGNHSRGRIKVTVQKL